MKTSLPNSNIAEQVILSYLLLNKPKNEIILNRISTEMFYSINHKIIYETILDLKKKNIEVNFDTVCSNLESSNHDNLSNFESILTDLINQSIRVGELESYLILLLDKYLRRSLIFSVNNVSRLAYDNSLSLETIFDQAEQLLFNVTQKKNLI
jgi:replicative DNA helicase